MTLGQLIAWIKAFGLSSWRMITDGQVLVRSGSGWAGKTIGAGAGTICAGDDARLTDDRNPLSHNATHRTGGSDTMVPIALALTDAPGAAPGGGAVTFDATYDWPGAYRFLIMTGAAGQARTIGAPLHCYVGQVLRLKIVQGAGATEIVAWNAAWKWSGGAIVVAVGAGAITYVEGIVTAVDGTDTATEILTGAAKGYA